MKPVFSVQANVLTDNSVTYDVVSDAIDYLPLSHEQAESLADHLNHALHLFVDNNGLCNDHRCQYIDKLMRGA